MIAPEPFFEPRGTPFSEYHRIRALLDLGHTVDLVTYPFGKDVTLPGLRIFRAARPPFITRVKIGPSPAKLFLDMTLTLTALNRARKGQYDAVHSHEEGAAIGVVISAALGIPHLYDMHSSLPQQLENFAFSRSSVLRWMFQVLERTAIKRSRVTIVICPHLEVTARKVVPGARVVLIENAPGSGDVPVAGSGTAIRAVARHRRDGADGALHRNVRGVSGARPSLCRGEGGARRSGPTCASCSPGGKPDQVAPREGASGGDRRRRPHLHRRAAIGGDSGYLDAADVLVSPRSSGTNTPLKIYQYLRSGRVIVATRLLTHTQVLSDEVAILTEPTPEVLRAASCRRSTIRRPPRRIGDAAKRLADTRYTYEAYLQRTREACAALVA